MRKSKVLKNLNNGEISISISASFTASSKITELVGILGYDCIWIDMEHRPYDYKEVFNLIQGARASDVDCLVRIRKESYASYFRAFEDGAAGIMVPHCRSREEAEMIVENAKYPPIGLRGVDGVGVDADYGLAKPKDHIKNANEETFVVVQIEDKIAVEKIDEIASVKGIDLLFVGPGDLSKSYGVMGNTKHPDVLLAIEKVAKAARKYEINWGLPVGTLDDAKEFAKMGAKLINIGSDRGVLVNGLKNLLDNYIELKECSEGK